MPARLGGREGRRGQLRIGEAGVHHVAAFGIAHLGAVAQIVADAVEDGHRRKVVGTVAAYHEIVLVGQRSGDQHAGGLFLVEGQGFVFIFEQHERLALDVEYEIAVFVGSGLGNGLPGGVIGVVEEPEAELYPQDLAHAPIHDLHREASLPDELAHRKDEPRRGREVRAHVQTRFEHLPHGIFVSLGHGRVWCGRIPQPRCR